MSSSTLILSLTTPSLLMRVSKVFLFSVADFLYLLLILSFYLFTLPIRSCILCIFSNRFFSILIIVILNSIYLIIPKPIYLRSLVLMVALSLQSVVLLLACLVIFLLKAGHDL